MQARNSSGPHHAGTSPVSAALHVQRKYRWQARRAVLFPVQRNVLQIERRISHFEKMSRAFSLRYSVFFVRRTAHP